MLKNNMEIVKIINKKNKKLNIKNKKKLNKLGKYI